MTLWLLIAAWVLLVLVGRWFEDRPRRPVEGKPDYKKIECLEIELGIVEAPKPTPRQPWSFVGAGGTFEPRRGPIQAVTRDLTDEEARRFARDAGLAKARHYHQPRMLVPPTAHWVIEDCHFDDSSEEMVF